MRAAADRAAVAVVEQGAQPLAIVVVSVARVDVAAVDNEDIRVVGKRADVSYLYPPFTMTTKLER